MHGRRAENLIRGRIEEEGAIAFSKYMEFCLNAPGLGYYMAGGAKFGPEGDFVTAPEISTLFGRCVARQFEEVLDLLGEGEILEIGGGTGAFAESCLAELSRRDAAAPRRYRILETSPDLRDRQRRRLEPLGVEWLETLPEDPFDGIVFANEVVDALPVERFRLSPEGVESMHVDANPDGLRWVAGRRGARSANTSGPSRAGSAARWERPATSRSGVPPSRAGSKRSRPTSAEGSCSSSTTATGRPSTITRTATAAPSGATTATAGTTIRSSSPPSRTSPRAWTSAPSRGPAMRPGWTGWASRPRHGSSSGAG